MSKTKERLFMALGIVLMLVIWELISLAIARPLFLPDPITVLGKLCHFFIEASFYQAILATLVRVVICFALSFLVGGILAVLAYSFKSMEYMLKPFMSLLRTVPTLAVIMLIVVWFSSQTAPLIVGMILLVPLLYQNIFTGLKNADVKLLEMANAFKVSKFKIWEKIIFPSAMHSTLSQFPATASLGLKVIIAAEILGQPIRGIGNSLNLAKISLDVPEIMAWLIVAAFIGSLFDITNFFLNKKKQKGGIINDQN